MRKFKFYCGDMTCPTRQEVQSDGSVGRLFSIDESDLPDGVWTCSLHDLAREEAS